jgi:hypothetical protein
VKRNRLNRFLFINEIHRKGSGVSDQARIWYKCEIHVLRGALENEKAGSWILRDLLAK